MGGADRIPPGPKGRGPFTEEDKFKLPDGRVYVPGDPASEGLYGRSLKLDHAGLQVFILFSAGAALNNPFILADNLKGPVAAAVSLKSYDFTLHIKI